MSEAKVSIVVTWGDGLPIINSHGYLNKWLCEVMKQLKNITSDLSQYL